MKQRKIPGGIDCELMIDASVDDVWAALTVADELTNWFPMDAEITPGVGGTIKMGWGDSEHQGEMAITKWQPNRLLRLEGEGFGPQWKSFTHYQEYRIEAVDGATRLTLVHSGFGEGDDWDDYMDPFRRGWAFELRGLRHYLENHRGTPRQVIWARRQVTNLSLDAVWGRLTTALAWPAGDFIEGDTYETALGWAGELMIFGPPKDLAATVVPLKNAYLRLKVDEHFDHPGELDVNLWLSVFGMEPAEIEALQAELEALIGVVG